MSTAAGERQHSVRFYVERHHRDGRHETVDAHATEAEGWDAIAFYRRINPEDTWLLVRYEVRESVLAPAADRAGLRALEEHKQQSAAYGPIDRADPLGMQHNSTTQATVAPLDYQCTRCGGLVQQRDVFVGGRLQWSHVFAPPECRGDCGRRRDAIGPGDPA